MFSQPQVFHFGRWECKIPPFFSLFAGSPISFLTIAYLKLILATVQNTLSNI